MTVGDKKEVLSTFGSSPKTPCHPKADVIGKKKDIVLKKTF